MNTSSILRAQLADDPFNELLAGILADAVAEEEDWLPEVAQQWVAAWVQHYKDAREITAAVAHIRPRAKHRQLLLRRIRWAIGLPYRAPLTLIVVEGESLSQPTAPPLKGNSRYWPEQTVLIGARRVLRYVESIEYEAAQGITKAVEKIERSL